jgi:EmrB/QacA subfamily drug resistance transporter
MAMTTAVLEAAPIVVEKSAPAAYRWRWPAMAVILAGSVMELLDMTVANIAGPSMRAELGGSASVIQWFGIAYTLATTAGLLTGGRLGDMYGRRQMFIIGAAGFTLGSLLCAVSTSPEMLIAARVLQGLAGAAMIPQGLGLIKQMFPPKEMQAAFALFGPVMGLSSVGGPILAGWLVDADLLGTGWRMIFLINLPIGIAAVAGALRFLPESRSATPVRLDVRGVVLAASASLLLVYPLVQGHELGWPAWTFAMMVAAAAVFVFFGRYEAAVGRAGGDPLVLQSLFRKRSFTGGLVVGVVLFATMSGFMLVLNLYTQLALGYSPLKAGLTTVPFSVGMIVGMGLSQSLQRFGRKVLLAGGVVKAAGLLGVLVAVAAGGSVSPWQLLPGLLVAGLGSALIMAPYFGFALADVAPEESGSASGTLTAVQQFGGAVGVALLGTMFFGAGVQTVLWTATGLLALGFVAAFLLPQHASTH